MRWIFGLALVIAEISMVAWCLLGIFAICDVEFTYDKCWGIIFLANVAGATMSVTSTLFKETQ